MKNLLVFSMLTVLFLSSCSIKSFIDSNEDNNKMVSAATVVTSTKKVIEILENTEMIKEYVKLRKECESMVLTAHQMRIDGEIEEDNYSLLQEEYAASKARFDEMFIKIAKDLTNKYKRQTLLNDPETYSDAWLSRFKEVVNMHNNNFVANYEEVVESASGIIAIASTIFKISKMIFNVTGLDAHLQNLALDKFKEKILDKWSLRHWDDITATA